jgi:hypothetical protein
MAGFGHERPFMVTLAKGRLRIRKQPFGRRFSTAGLDTKATSGRL